jgi:uncharacterized protein YndB with AHSA1/START domain
MAKFAIATDMPGTPERVFEVLTDPGRLDEWHTMHDGWPGEAPTEMQEGGTFQQNLKLAAMPAEMTWTIKRLTAPTTLEMEGVGPMGVTMRSLFSVEAAGGGSRIAVESEIGGNPFVGPLAKPVKQAHEESFDRLKLLVG